MNKPLNRQARTECQHAQWDDYGPVSFAEAARSLAQFYDQDEIDIEVRDEAEPDDVRTIIVRRVVSFQCVNLRGDADECS